MFNNKIIQLKNTPYESDGIVIKYDIEDKYIIKTRQTNKDKYVWFLTHISKDNGLYKLIAFSTELFDTPQDAESNAFDYLVKIGVYNKQ